MCDLILFLQQPDQVGLSILQNREQKQRLTQGCLVSLRAEPHSVSLIMALYINFDWLMCKYFVCVRVCTRVCARERREKERKYNKFCKSLMFLPHFSS